jgi:F0F1-type ATP synthase delta subunit
MEGGMAPEKALQHLDTVLSRRGHEKLRKRILRAAERILTRQSEFQVPTVYVAGDAAAKHERHAIDAALKTLGAKGPHHTEVDETLIGGFRIVAGGKELDQSYKRQLLTLYRRIINETT